MSLDTINYAAVLNALADEISEIAERKGFWDFDHLGIGTDGAAIPLKLALIHSEVTEALNAYRLAYDDETEDPTTGMTSMQEDDFAEEIADVIIRALDLVGYFGFDIGQIILDKINVNRARPYRHGKRF